MDSIVTTRIRQDELLDEVTQRGSLIYETQLKAELERQHMGGYVAIHPDSGTYVVSEREEEAARRLRALQPDGLLFLRRIGPPTSGDLRLAARLTGRSGGK